MGGRDFKKIIPHIKIKSKEYGGLSSVLKRKSNKRPNDNNYKCNACD